MSFPIKLIGILYIILSFQCSVFPEENCKFGPWNTLNQEKFLSETRYWLDLPYVRGGMKIEGPGRGADCSGLVKGILESQNVRVPEKCVSRRAEVQAEELGVEISCKEIRVGDLVFFKDKPDTTIVTHVGIMTSRIRFVHARRPGLLSTEEEIARDYWQQRLVQCRRLFIDLE